MIKVSVIVPIYKVEKYLRRCIESLINQTLDKIEIILVDDGSPDSSGKIADEYASYKNVKIIHKKNGGLSSARNAGIAVALGEYIGFVDSDDYVELDMFEYLYNNAEKNDSDIAACGYTVIYPNNKIEKITRNLGNAIYTKEEAMDIHLFSGYIDNIACNKIFKRELFNEINFEIGKLYEDIILMPKLFNLCKVISLHTDSKYNYCKRNDSIAGSSFSKKTLALIDACNEDVNYCLSIFPDIKNIKIARIQWHVVVANKMILGNYKDRDFVRKIKSMIRANIINIIKCRYINLKRKIQLFLFGYCYSFYKFLYKNFFRSDGE